MFIFWSTSGKWGEKRLRSLKSKEGRVSRGQKRTRKTIKFKSNPNDRLSISKNRQLDNNDSIIHDKKECKWPFDSWPQKKSRNSHYRMTFNRGNYQKRSQRNKNLINPSKKLDKDRWHATSGPSKKSEIKRSQNNKQSIKKKIFFESH